MKDRSGTQQWLDCLIIRPIYPNLCSQDLPNTGTVCKWNTVTAQIVYRNGRKESAKWSSCGRPHGPPFLPSPLFQLLFIHSSYIHHAFIMRFFPWWFSHLLAIPLHCVDPMSQVIRLGIHGNDLLVTCAAPTDCHCRMCGDRGRPWSVRNFKLWETDGNCISIVSIVSNYLCFFKQRSFWIWGKSFMWNFTEPQHLKHQRCTWTCLDSSMFPVYVMIVVIVMSLWN